MADAPHDGWLLVADLWSRLQFCDHTCQSGGYFGEPFGIPSIGLRLIWLSICSRLIQYFGQTRRRNAANLGQFSRWSWFRSTTTRISSRGSSVSRRKSSRWLSWCQEWRACPRRLRSFSWYAGLRGIRFPPRPTPLLSWWIWLNDGGSAHHTIQSASFRRKFHSAFGSCLQNWDELSLSWHQQNTRWAGTAVWRSVRLNTHSCEKQSNWQAVSCVRWLCMRRPSWRQSAGGFILSPDMSVDASRNLGQQIRISMSHKNIDWKSIRASAWMRLSHSHLRSGWRLRKTLFSGFHWPWDVASIDDGNVDMISIFCSVSPGLSVFLWVSAGGLHGSQGHSHSNSACSK